MHIIQEYKNKCTIDIPSFPSANKVLPRAWGDVVKQMRHTVVHTENVSNLDARGLSNVLWSLGHLYVQFDDLSVLLKVRE